MGSGCDAGADACIVNAYDGVDVVSPHHMHRCCCDGHDVAFRRNLQVRQVVSASDGCDGFVVAESSYAEPLVHGVT